MAKAKEEVQCTLPGNSSTSSNTSKNTSSNTYIHIEAEDRDNALMHYIPDQEIDVTRLWFA